MAARRSSTLGGLLGLFARQGFDGAQARVDDRCLDKICRCAALARHILPGMCATAKAALSSGADEYDACFPVTYLVGELADVLVLFR